MNVLRCMHSCVLRPIDVAESLSYVEDELFEHIFKHYQKNSIAKLRGGGAVQVTVGFTLIQLNHLVCKSSM